MTKKVQVNVNFVKKTAVLAKVEVSSSEMLAYVSELTEIVDYVQTLNEVDTEGVPPTYQVIDDQKNVFREDVVTPSLSQTEALSQTKRKYKGYFVVERILHDR